MFSCCTLFGNDFATTTTTTVIIIIAAFVLLFDLNLLEFLNIPTLPKTGINGYTCLANTPAQNQGAGRAAGVEKAGEIELKYNFNNCVYRVKVPDQQTGIIGTIHFQEGLVRIVNTFEECLAFRRKQGTNSYLIKTESGEKLASVEIFRGFRGDIIYYGLSILGDVSSTNKALLIALTVIMDIRQRESQMRCTLLWTPLLCVLVIGFFTIVPWMYFSAE